MSSGILKANRKKSRATAHAVHALVERLEERRLLSGDVRLIGITGNQDSNDPGFGNDETLYDVSVGQPGTHDPTFLDGWEDITTNPPDTVLSVSTTFGVSQGKGALRVDVDNGVGAYWGIRSPNIVDLLAAGVTEFGYDLTLDNKELNGGAYGGNGDDSFNGYAQNNELAVQISTPTNGFIQRDFGTAHGTDSLNTNATWSGVNGTRTITWDLTTFTSEGMSISDFIATHHPNDAHFWLVTQGADTNGHVGPMRFYFDNMYVKFTDGSTQTIGDFELLNISKIIQTPHVPDTDSIAFNPESGLLHRISGASSYRNNPARIGYRDDQFMETLNINDPVNSQVGIFNANYEGGPMFDPTDGTNINYGLPAPFPTWVFPDHRRTDDETDPSFEASGPNEFHSMRDFTWSNDQHLFIGTDESGLYKLTADGQSTFFSFPISQPKGITFYTAPDGQRKLMEEWLPQDGMSGDGMETKS